MADRVRKIIAGILSFVLIFALLLHMGSLQPYSVNAAPKTIRLKQAKNLALANSSTYKSIKSRIELKKVSYTQAVKSLNLKKKNMSTFRWTPLLSFKFPEKADLIDESEFVYKPMQITNEITELKHQLNDETYAVYETISNLYTEIYGYQILIEFEESQLEELRKTLERNKERLILGLANKEDVEAIEQDIENLEINLAADMKKFESGKEEFSDLTGLNVTTGYVFENPYVDAHIPRSELDSIIEHTLNNDHSYYSAKMDTALALLLVETNYDLMQNQYGNKMSYISTYVSQVKNGENVDGSAFKAAYDKFLTAIDEPWTGKKKITFIKVPKEWFKGSIDGVRYVEDEPYVLYEESLEYLEVLQTQKDMAKEIEKQVRDSYETLVTARNSYLNLKSQLAKEKEKLDKALILNSLGECTFEEYTDARIQYEELQIEELEAFQLYTTLLYSFDRLTCGGVTEYIDSESFSLEGETGGDSYLVEADSDKASYYINSIIEDNMFEFGINIPDDFETEITHYELWADSYQIGTRTEIDKNIRHLMISMTDVEKFKVRVYAGEEFIDECTIDTQVYQGELTIITGYTISKSERERDIGTYNITENHSSTMVEIELNIAAEEGVGYYSLLNSEGKYILSEEPISADTAFEYLSFISGNLDGITIKCYNSSKEYLYDAGFRSRDYSIYQKAATKGDEP